MKNNGMSSNRDLCSVPSCVWSTRTTKVSQWNTSFITFFGTWWSGCIIILFHVWIQMCQVIRFYPFAGLYSVKKINSRAHLYLAESTMNPRLNFTLHPSGGHHCKFDWTDTGAKQGFSQLIVEICRENIEKIPDWIYLFKKQGLSQT